MPHCYCFRDVRHFSFWLSFHLFTAATFVLVIGWVFPPHALPTGKSHRLIDSCVGIRIKAWLLCFGHCLFGSTEYAHEACVSTRDVDNAQQIASLTCFLYCGLVRFVSWDFTSQNLIDCIKIYVPIDSFFSMNHDSFQNNEHLWYCNGQKQWRFWI